MMDLIAFSVVEVAVRIAVVALGAAVVHIGGVDPAVDTVVLAEAVVHTGGAPAVGAPAVDMAALVVGMVAAAVRKVVAALEVRQSLHWVESVAVVAAGYMGRNHHLVEDVVVAVVRTVVVDHKEAVVHMVVVEVVLAAAAGFAAPRQLHLQVLVLLWCYFALNYCRCARVLPFNCPELHR